MLPKIHLALRQWELVAPDHCLSNPFFSRNPHSTKIPIVIFYGDNIPEKPTAHRGQDHWSVRMAMARLFRDAGNRQGGVVSLVRLRYTGECCALRCRGR